MGIIGRVYDAALEPSRWQTFVDDLADLYSGTAALSSQEPLAVDTRICAASGIDPAFGRSYEQYYSQRRPWAASVGRVALGEVFEPRSLIDEAGYESSEYFNDWLHPQDIYHLLSCPLARDGSATAFLTVSRSRRAGEFETAELALIARLAPHLQRSMEMHRRLCSATQQRDALSRSLDGLGVGVILVDRDGRVRTVNRIGEAIVARGDGLIARNGRLQARTRAATDTLHRLIREGADTGAGLARGSGGVLALPCAQGRHLHALVCPFPMNNTEWTGSSLPTAFIFVSEPGRNSTPRPADLARLYGLTPAEARLMSALAGGTSLNDYAAATEIGRATAKTHLQNIFIKVDGHRQSDVVRAALANGIAQIAAASRQIESQGSFSTAGFTPARAQARAARGARTPSAMAMRKSAGTSPTR